MASTYSDLKIELIGTGDQSGTWGATTNTNLGTALEEAIVGRATVNFTSDANLTITLSNVNTTQVARNYILNVTSAVALTVTRSLIVPTIDKPYVIENNTTGGQSILVKTSAGTGITVPTGKTVMVYANGTNVVQAFDYVPSVTAGAITDSGLTAGRVTYAGTAGLLADSASLTFDGTTLSTTTVDATNLEVTNLKAKDGTAAGSIANSTGVVTIASSVLTTTDINGGTIDATAIGGSTPAAGAFTSGSFSTTLGVTGVATLTAQPILSSLTASSAVATDASKGLVSVTNTGTGNNVLATSPTITGATLTTAALNGSLGATTPSTVVATTGTFKNALMTNPVTLSGNSTNTTYGLLSFNNVDTAAGTVGIWGGADNDIRYNVPTAGSHIFRTNNVTQATIDSSGNVGIGVTPSAWYTAGGTKVLQVGNRASLFSYNSTTTDLANNVYQTAAGDYSYIQTEAASLYRQHAGVHYWYSAPSGTAGDPITFTTAMTLDASSNLTVTGGATIQGLTVGKGGGAVATNTAVGTSALAANTTGANNTGVGYLALTTNSTGSNNSAFGLYALRLNTGASNSAFGVQALDANTGSYNSAFGQGALQANTTASNNTAVGYQAGYSNTTGGFGVFVGRQAGYSNSTANSNVAVGESALYTNATGTNNIAVGQAALYTNTGSYNTAVGQAALVYNTTASNNTAVGYQAGYLITTGSKNTIIGSYNGNQGGLDIRTASNYIVLSDGDGNPLVSTNSTSSVALNGATPKTGTGITFPATQSASTDANTLDDYEEGDVTLGATTTLTAGTGTITINTGTSFVKYTKIGRQVTVAGLLVVSSVSSPTANLALNGMPFAAGANCYSAVSIYSYGYAATMTTTVIGSMSDGSTSLSLQKTNALGSVAVLAPDVQAGTNIQFSVTYFV